jgi:uncharacterized Zn finger protein
MMNSTLPKISHADIQHWVGPSSFRKGMAYFSRGAITQTRLQRNLLKARCHGSQAASYQLQVALGPAGIVFATCSCPVGAEGRCKHVAALLLTWVDRPAAFTEIDDLAVSLQKRSKEELIAILQRMLQREPDLETLLELPLPGIEASEKPLHVQVIRRQAEHAFKSSNAEWEMDWGDPAEIVDGLQPLFDLAGGYQGQNNPGNAATVYQIVADTILDYEDAITQDDDGYLGGALNDCIEGLRNSLEAISEEKQRESILKTLFDVYAWDVKAGGLGIGDSVPLHLLELTTAAERQLISSWIQPILPDLRDWSRQTMGELLLGLQADTLDDDAFLQTCRQTGRLDDLLERLLSLKRIDEAMDETKKASDYTLLSLADLFIKHGHDPLAEGLVRDRAAARSDTRLTHWLREHAQKKGDLRQAVAYAEKEFWQRPEVSLYIGMRKLAADLGEWPELRAKMLDRLSQSGKYRLLTEIFLEEGEIDLALESLERDKASARYWGNQALQEQVARVARIQRPKPAIRLYLQLAESLIQVHGRGNYAKAAGYIRAVREIYLSMHDPQAWQAVSASLREQNRNLPALLDELDRAGL